MSTLQAFSSIDLVAQCMVDEERSLAFQQAISSVVQPGTDVVDLGTGTGILALFAAQAGAKEVTALEYDPFVTSEAKRNITENEFDSIIKVITGDACSYDFDRSHPFDVVVLELLTTGMIDEVQIPAINNLHRQGLIGTHTRVVPFQVDTFAALASVDFSVAGLKMKMVRHLWKGFPTSHQTKLITNQVILSSVEFSKFCPESYEGLLKFEVLEDTIVNAIHLSSRTYLAPGVTLDDTLTLNAPVIIPLPEYEVKKGSIIPVEIAFCYGGGYETLNLQMLSLVNEWVQNSMQ